MKLGFSLIELLVVLAIIALLTTFIYPSYQTYLYRVHRLDGQIALWQLAARLEEYYTQTQTYQTATIGTGLDTDVVSHNFSPDHWYVLRIVVATDSNFTVQAIPRLAQANDRECQTLSLMSNGQKSIGSGPRGRPQGTVERCWNN